MFFGSIPALVTPFAGGRVAEDTFREFVEWQIAEGSQRAGPVRNDRRSRDADRDEHRHVIAPAVEAAKGRVPVIAGCGTYSTAASIERIARRGRRRRRRRAGRRALLQQAEPGRACGAFHGHRRCLAAADRRLQCPVADGRRHLGRDPGGSSRSIPRSSRSRTRPATSPGSPPSGSPAARTSASCRATTTWRSASTPWAGSAASRSPPMSRRSSAPTSRRRCAKAAGTKR